MRPNSVTNTAVATFDADPDDTVVLPRTVTRVRRDGRSSSPNLQIAKSASAAGDTVFPGRDGHLPARRHQPGRPGEHSPRPRHRRRLLRRLRRRGRRPGRRHRRRRHDHVDGSLRSRPARRSRGRTQVILDSPLLAGDTLDEHGDGDGHVARRRRRSASGRRRRRARPQRARATSTPTTTTLIVDGPRVAKDPLFGTLETIGGIQTYVIRGDPAGQPRLRIRGGHAHRRPQRWPHHVRRDGRGRAASTARMRNGRSS